MDIVDKQPLVVVVKLNENIFQASWTDELVGIDTQKTLTDIPFRWWDLLPYLLARYLFELGYHPAQQLVLKFDGEVKIKTEAIYHEGVKYSEDCNFDMAAAISEKFEHMRATIGELLDTPLINRASMFAQPGYWTPPWYTEVKPHLVEA